MIDRRMLLSTGTLLVSIGLLLCTPRPAMAMPCQDELYQYYTDASYTELVGYWGMDCYGHEHEAGYDWPYGPPPHLTPYYVQSEACCDNGSCGNGEDCPGDFYDCTYAPCPPQFPSRPW